MGIVGMGRLDRQLPLPPHQIILLQILVGVLDGLHSGHTHALHQPVLRRPEISFHASFRLGRMSRYPTDPQFRSDIGWRARWSSLRPHACPSPAGLAPSRNFFPRVLSPGENEPLSNRSPAPVRRGRSASAAFPPDPCPPPPHPVCASPPSETSSPCRYRRTPAGRTFPGSSTTVSYFPRSNHAARIARIIGWWHRRSWRSGRASLPALPAT